MRKFPFKSGPISTVITIVIVALGFIGCGGLPSAKKSAADKPDIQTAADDCLKNENVAASAFIALRTDLFSVAPKCNEKLFQLAMLQVHWLALNKGQAATTAAHEQVPGTPGFTGATLKDRIVVAGLAGHSFHIAESVASGTMPAAFVPKHLASVFHRAIMLAPGLLSFGLADDGGGLQIMTAMIDASGAGQSEVYYPNEQEAVPIVRNFSERPFDQLKTAGDGFPVSVHFPWDCASKYGPVIKAFKLASVDGPVGASIFSHHTTADIRSSDVFLIPNLPLTPGTWYSVTADLRCGSRVFKKTWSFETVLNPS